MLESLQLVKPKFWNDFYLKKNIWEFQYVFVKEYWKMDPWPLMASPSGGSLDMITLEAGNPQKKIQTEDICTIISEMNGNLRAFFGNNRKPIFIRNS